MCTHRVDRFNCFRTVLLSIIILSILMLKPEVGRSTTIEASSGPAQGSEPSNKEVSWKNFTISKIEPDLKNEQVIITFSQSCSLGKVRDTLKIYPPVDLHWYWSKMKDGVLNLEGAFKPGQEYQIVMSQDLKCMFRSYVPTLTHFRMPDLEPSLEFALKGTIIERDSRQMLHASIVNIEELAYRGFRIPPILLTAALDELKNNAPFVKVKETLRERHERMASMVTRHNELHHFVQGIQDEEQLFFPGAEPNQRKTFSIPLNFRKDTEKGSIDLISLKGTGLGKTVRSPSRIFRITDMSLTYKLSEDSLLIWVTSLGSGQPLKDVSILAFTGFSTAAFLGQTDEKGLLLMKDTEMKKHFFLKGEQEIAQAPMLLKDLHILMAASATDASFIIVEKDGNVRPDWIHQARIREEKGRLLKGHVFTERGIYRPGDRVHFKGTLRSFKDGVIAPVQDMEPSFVIMNAKDEKVYEEKLKLSDFGTASDSFQVKPFFPLGTYTIQMKFSEDTEGTASRTFEVQEFRPPRHFTEIQYEHIKQKDEDYVNLDKEIDLLKCDISGSYYAGGPVKHGKVRWKIYYTSTDFPISEFPEFSFGTHIDRRAELLESGESILDEQGRISVTLPMSNEVVSGVYGVDVVATVVDFDGRAATETSVYQKKPEYLVGIGPHAETIHAGDKELLKLMVLDGKGVRIPSGTLHVEVQKKDSVYVKKRDAAGDVFWDYDEAWRREFSTTLPITGGMARFEFDFVWGGDYLMKFTYRGTDGKGFASSTVYHVEGNFYGFEYENRERNFEKLLIMPERSVYSPGETIRVFINPHRMLSTLLLTIEKDDVLEHRVMDLDPGQKFVEIPVSRDHIPNIYVSVLGTVARGDFPVYSGEFDDEAPSFLYGVANIEIKNNVEKLHLSINEKEPNLKAEPGAEVILRIATTDDQGKGVVSEMAVCVVDESILALTGFKTPTLDTLSRFISPLSVFTGDLRTELLKQTPFGFIRNEPHTGGGGLEKKADAPTTKVRKDFRPVAYFNPAVRTDAEGIAQVGFTLPDSMTTYRVYAVACDRGSRFASGERGLLSVKDFYLEPGIPRFFTRGDSFRFQVGAYNKTDQTGDVVFTVGQDNLVDLMAGGEVLSLKAYDRVLLPVEGNTVKPGMSQMVFSGEFRNLEDRVELKMPIHSGHLLWNDIRFGTLRGSKIVRYDFPEGTDNIAWEDLGPDDVKAVLTVSGSPFLRISRGLHYFLKYPYGCVEQTSSGVLPLAALRGLIQEGLIPDITIGKTDSYLKSGVDRLLSMQTSSGGFGYWPGNIHPHRWGTIYAAMALTQAGRAGFDLPEDQLAMAMNYLKKELQDEDNKDRTFQAFAAYILSLNGELDKKLYKELFDKKDHFPREGGLLLFLAAHEAGYLTGDALTKPTRDLLKRKWLWKKSGTFYARYREPAISLLTGAAILPDDIATGSLASQLLGGVNKQGIWTSTSDTGWSLLALGEYFKGKSFSDKPAQVSLKQSGKSSADVMLDPKGSHAFSLDAQSFLQDPELQITSDPEMDLVYMLSLTFPRVDYAEHGFSNGFTIHKEVANTDGSKRIKVGDVVKVTLTIGIEDHNYRFIVIDDPLPGGLVAINSALKTEEDVGESQKTSDEAGRWDDWDFESGFYRFVPNFFEIRDERVLIFKDLSWRGTYQYSYYARAVCEGEFIMPSTKIQLMYEPDTASYTAVGRLIIEGR